MIRFGKEMANNDTLKEAVSLMGELLCQEKKCIIEEFHNEGLSEKRP